jgi:hypothetical protein
MSARPGRIVEEFRVDIPDRADVMKRRRDPRVTGYVMRLMDLLRIESQAAGAAA